MRGRPGGMYVVGDTPHDVAAAWQSERERSPSRPAGTRRGGWRPPTPGGRLPSCHRREEFIALLSGAGGRRPMYERGCRRERGGDCSSPPHSACAAELPCDRAGRRAGETFGLAPEFISPYQQEDFAHRRAGSIRIISCPRCRGLGGTDDRRHVFPGPGVQEHPSDRIFDRVSRASLLTIGLSKRLSLQWPIAKALTVLAPRGSERRRWLRELYAAYRPRAQRCRRFSTRPSLPWCSSHRQVIFGWTTSFSMRPAGAEPVPCAL